MTPRRGRIRDFYGPRRPGSPDAVVGAASYAHAMTVSAESEVRRHSATGLFHGCDRRMQRSPGCHARPPMRRLGPTPNRGTGGRHRARGTITSPGVPMTTGAEPELVRGSVALRPRAPHGYALVAVVGALGAVLTWAEEGGFRSDRQLPLGGRGAATAGVADVVHLARWACLPDDTRIPPPPALHPLCAGSATLASGSSPK